MIERKALRQAPRQGDGYAWEVGGVKDGASIGSTIARNRDYRRSVQERRTVNHRSSLLRCRECECLNGAVGLIEPHCRHRGQADRAF
jgi:hypothetical protein